MKIIKKAAANSFMDFVNVDEGTAVWSVPHELHRRNDPGLGGFSTAHSRMATASGKITAGQELFVSYGSNWYVRMMMILSLCVSVVMWVVSFLGGGAGRFEDCWTHAGPPRVRGEGGAVLGVKQA